jgi:PhzF family phenazine biosynthesis protein
VRTSLFQLDSFTTKRFAGNPAAVMLLDAYPSDDVLLALAAENNLSETAFIVRAGNDYRIRWFTPMLEVSLCGHATLASAAVVIERLEPARERVVFHSASGPLTVTRTQSGYAMDFPARFAQPVEAPAGVERTLGATPEHVLANEHNVLFVFERAQTVRGLQPDLAAVAALPWPGAIVTAPGDGDYDMVSRYFAPRKGIPEDPVTGGAHCTLTPYWAQRLGKTKLHAYQASKRGGEMDCTLAGVRVVLEGACVFYLEGTVEI